MALRRLGAIILPSRLNLKLFDTVWYKHARLAAYFPQQFNLRQTGCTRRSSRYHTKCLGFALIFHAGV